MDCSKQLSKICARPDLSIICSKPKKSCSCNSYGKRKKLKKLFSKHSPNFIRTRFFRKKKASRSQQDVFYVEKKDTMQRIFLTSRTKRSNTWSARYQISHQILISTTTTWNQFYLTIVMTTKPFVDTQTLTTLLNRLQMKVKTVFSKSQKFQNNKKYNLCIFLW